MCVALKFVFEMIEIVLFVFRGAMLKFMHAEEQHASSLEPEPPSRSPQLRILCAEWGLLRLAGSHADGQPMGRQQSSSVHMYIHAFAFRSLFGH